MPADEYPEDSGSGVCAGPTVLARVVVVVGQSLRFDPGPLLQRRLIEEVLLGGQPTECFAELAVIHRRVTGVTNVGILDHGDEVPLELVPLETTRVA
jgi:hypothetical protein